MARHKLFFNILFSLLVVISIAACNNNKPIKTRTPKVVDSKHVWSYGQLTETIRNAKVIAQVNNGMYCGRATCASVSIIEVNKKDTIRVLELSSMHADFAEGARVNIKPGNKPISFVSMPVIAAYDRKNYKTYYGTILAAN
ncbi:hypothetical protein [Mucilaginibacter psychrotolerans]|uniref:Lipoprotein n=1 Tax=Mucilaginibacter psychrotolerans TaxID=1524096 RepID=A0A4Y8S5B3_9SPHI|nr:hypothetical protein [Mucilaginibacter psychrotolerans]TFF33815.1 hypothetical protein E2R66_24090 [Mucilaginibacter psychrotolerans]